MISVIFASHNGSRTLPLTLASFRALNRPSCGVEFIAINNASNDSTTEILESYRRYIPIKILNEPRPGKSFAINLGIRSAKGSLLVFTDDDIVADPNWLTGYIDAADTHPDVSLFSGQVRHYWEMPPPEWLRTLALEGRSYAGTPSNLSDGPVSVKYVKGPNFMVRQKVVQHLTFCEDTGINFVGQGTSHGGEETAFVKRALASGFELHHVSAARVQHIVRKEQIGILPVFKRYVRLGRAGFLQNERTDTYNGPRIFGYPRYLYKMIPKEIARIGYKWIIGRHNEGANALLDLAFICGNEIERQKRAQTSVSPIIVEHKND
ncbi:hypothetical protein CKO28_24225 [Rhodovibrio sodomensis]|uniref:Glycosyltransferase 2-like domain-containing protein n=1 Tax=Rhodovibrio sodomensis TaxID=1088 RepID=A0ABS1DKR4_9PROT|nr:glycosyltransferase family 2 protein [Rhodovibrio sodomensis]MBK1671116.1 hypothetical protein [Rhodovibrio sodomensis]